MMQWAIITNIIIITISFINLYGFHPQGHRHQHSWTINNILTWISPGIYSNGTSSSSSSFSSTSVMWQEWYLCDLKTTIISNKSDSNLFRIIWIYKTNWFGYSHLRFHVLPIPVGVWFSWIFRSETVTNGGNNPPRNPQKRWGIGLRWRQWTNSWSEQIGKTALFQGVWRWRGSTQLGTFVRLVIFGSG